MLNTNTICERIPNPESRIPLADLVRDRGPLTVAAFMELALYDPEHGYYARAARRSGRAGDFFTSVDVGPLFGELLAVQIAEMAAQVLTGGPAEAAKAFDLVEAGAGNGRLSADILHAAKRHDPASTTRSGCTWSRRAPRRAPRSARRWRHRRSPRRPRAPALPDVVRRRADRERTARRDAGASGGDARRRVEGSVRRPPPATPNGRDDDRRRPALDAGAAGVSRSPRRRRSNRDGASRSTCRGRLDARRGAPAAPRVHGADRLRSRGARAVLGGAFGRHAHHRSRGIAAADAESAATRRPGCSDPGEQDITAHVDFTSVRAAAEAEGMETIALLDQTYFLLGLFDRIGGAVRDRATVARPPPNRPSARLARRGAADARRR